MCRLRVNQQLHSNLLVAVATYFEDRRCWKMGFQIEGEFPLPPFIHSIEVKGSDQDFHLILPRLISDELVPTLWGPARLITVEAAQHDLVRR